MSNNPRVHVRVSALNARRLRQSAQERNVNMGKLVDAALTLFFTPAEERPDALLLQRADGLEEQLQKVDMNLAFQSDLFVEFLFQWFQDRPMDSPLRTDADERRAKRDLDALTRRVIDRSNTAVWN